MIMSKDRKFVFIEVPKTGTSAVAKRLLEVDPTLKRDVVYLPEGTEQVCSTHITASEMRLALGHEAEEYCFIAFLRAPREQMISKYYFYKNGRAKTRIYDGSATFGRIVRHASTRLLPLHIWILVYPYKNSAHFVQDGQGRLCVDVLGDFNHLESHFRDIFSGFGYPRDHLTLVLSNSP